MAELVACGTCGEPRALANLIIVDGHPPICPECRSKRDAYAATHQVAAPAPANAAPPREPSLHVVDLPRSTRFSPAARAGRRRRSA